MFTDGEPWDAYYLRWTPNGWVSAWFPNNENPQLSGGIALTKDSAYLPLNPSTVLLEIIPLR